MSDDTDASRSRELLRAELAAITPVLQSNVLEKHVQKVAKLAGDYGSNVLNRESIEEAERKSWIMSDLFRLYDALSDINRSIGRIEGVVLRIGTSIDPEPEEEETQP